MKKKVAWVEHPVSAEQKAELVGKGFRIVDAKFAPEVVKAPDKLVMKPKPESEPEGE